MSLSERIATVRKAIVSLVGVLSALLAANLLPENIAGWVSTTVGVVTIVLTYWVPNADLPGKHAADRPVIYSDDTTTGQGISRPYTGPGAPNA